MILVMVGSSMLEHFLRSEVGSGSRSQCLSGDCANNFSISCTVTGLKLESSAGGEAGGGLCGSSMVE